MQVIAKNITRDIPRVPTYTPGYWSPTYPHYHDRLHAMKVAMACHLKYGMVHLWLEPM